MFRKNTALLKIKCGVFFSIFFLPIFALPQNPLETDRTLWYKARRYFAV